MTMPTVATVATVAVVHKDMHQRAGEQQQERQSPHNMRQVLSQQKVPCNRPHNNQPDRIAGAPETGWCFMPAMVMRHGDFQVISRQRLSWSGSSS